MGLARFVPVPTGSLLLPLAVAVALTLSGWLGEVQVPTALQWLAFALIGVQVGLRFTRKALAAITRMLPVVLALIVAVVVLTALTGALLAWLTPVDGLTAYLATTPGGLFAVLSTAADAGLLEMFATMTGTELTLIDDSTTPRSLAQELRANELYYALGAQR